MSRNQAPDSEFAFLTCLERHFPRSSPSLQTGRGDDCAVVSWPQQALISTDLFIEDVHFRRSYFSAAEIGHKALAVNLSDLAGMGGAALGFCCSVMVPSDEETLDTGFWDELFASMAALATRWDAPLVGGDLSRGPALGLSITVWGHSPRPVPRGGCAPGDALFVCGPSDSQANPLGLARTGLLHLEMHGRGARAIHPRAAMAHLQPEPLLDAAPVLADQPGVNSLMDLSDGLARDLPRLLGAELAPHEGRRTTHGAALEIPPESLHPELLASCEQSGRDPLREALLGGEDYCLLGACSDDVVPELQQRLPGFTVIGRVVGEHSLRCNGRNLESITGPGFDHFRGRE